MGSYVQKYICMKAREVPRPAPLQWSMATQARCRFQNCSKHPHFEAKCCSIVCSRCSCSTVCWRLWLGFFEIIKTANEATHSVRQFCLRFLVVWEGNVHLCHQFCDRNKACSCSPHDQEMRCTSFASRHMTWCQQLHAKQVPNRQKNKEVQELYGRIVQSTLTFAIEDTINNNWSLFCMFGCGTLFLIGSPVLIVYNSCRC